MGILYDPYASCRSNGSVLLNANESSLLRKMPSAWFFWESFPAVRTSP